MATTLKDMITDALYNSLDDFFAECEEKGLDAPNMADTAEDVCLVVKEFIDNQLQLD